MQQDEQILSFPVFTRYMDDHVAQEDLFTGPISQKINLWTFHPDFLTWRQSHDSASFLTTSNTESTSSAPEIVVLLKKYILHSSCLKSDLDWNVGKSDTD